MSTEKKEEKGLMKPVKLKKDLAKMLGADSLPRTEVTSKIWDYVKKNKLQTKTAGGKASGGGKFIVVDAVLLPVVKNTKSTSAKGKVTDLTGVKEGDTIDMMQIASVVGCNVE